MAQDVAPPFVLTTHTQAMLPQLCNLANEYKNQLLHVKEVGGDREAALQFLSYEGDSFHSDTSDSEEGACSYSCEGTYVYVDIQ